MRANRFDLQMIYLPDPGRGEYTAPMQQRETTVSVAIRSCRHAVMGLALACLSPLPVLSQGLDIQPISLDVAGDSNLVLAALPVAGGAPVFGSSLNETPGIVPVAVRRAAALPQPSIILGLIAPGEEEAFGVERLLPATVQEIAFELDDLAAREDLRARDPDLFRRLIEEGHLDPAPDQLNRVLQTELSRMNCYRSGIDGAWGPGSRRSVAAYFDELQTVSWPDQDPSAELFRQIILNGDVTCPVPVAVAPSAPAPSTNRAATSTRAPAAAAPAPAQAPQSNRPTLSNGLSGVGVFR